MPNANPITHLPDLAIGDRAQVVAFSDPEAAYTQTLTRLGLTPGTVFTVLRRAPLGDPIEIRFRGYSLALRPAEAAGMQLTRL